MKEKPTYRKPDKRQRKRIRDLEDFMGETNESGLFLAVAEEIAKGDNGTILLAALQILRRVRRDQVRILARLDGLASNAALARKYYAKPGGRT